MNILTAWLRSYLPELPVSDVQLAEDLTLRGIAVEGVFPASCGGSRFEMDITTNRVDAMNHYGVAREAAAIYDVRLNSLSDGLAAPLPASDAPAFPVRIEATDLCGRFTARVIRGVAVRPSTGLIADYFAALGQKPISAPVDATNFAWLAMGQPTHVFDLDTIEGGIVVRRAYEAEKLRLLDGSEHTLTPDDLVIADERRALSLAGVMGGWDSRVTEATKNILVEAAWFDPAAIRASSRRHGLHTDASHRFERGADFNAAPVGNDLVTRLVLQQCGGVVEGPPADMVIDALAARTASRKPIVLRVAEVQRHLGTTLNDAQMHAASDQRTSGLSENLVEQYLTALGCTLERNGGAPGEYSVTLPSWRLDLAREIDLIEEVARVYGYDRFADTLPAFAGPVIEQPHSEQERALRETLLSLGFSETISTTFVSGSEAATFGPAASGAVAIGNPLSDEAGMLRPSLTPGLVNMLALNLHRDVDVVRLFELGTIFTGSTAEVHETTSLALGATGDMPTSARYQSEDALFYAVKGALEALLAKFSGEVRTVIGDLPAWIAPGRGARVLLDGTPIASFGELHASEMSGRKLRTACVLAEVDAQQLLSTALRQPIARELSRFQAVQRDFSFVFSDTLQWTSIETAVRALGITELQRVTPLEIFRDPKGKAVAPGSYSLLLRVLLQSGERTLTDDEISGWSDRLVRALVALGGVQRTS